MTNQKAGRAKPDQAPEPDQAPAEKPAPPVKLEMPAEGGSYIRDPETGRLTKQED